MNINLTSEINLFLWQTRRFVNSSFFGSQTSWEEMTSRCARWPGMLRGTEGEENAQTQNCKIKNCKLKNSQIKYCQNPKLQNQTPKRVNKPLSICETTMWMQKGAGEGGEEAWAGDQEGGQDGEQAGLRTFKKSKYQDTKLPRWGTSRFGLQLDSHWIAKHVCFSMYESMSQPKAHKSCASGLDWGCWHVRENIAHRLRAGSERLK